MNKKLTFGKIAGIIFCILAAAGTVLLLCLNIYFGGQMKLVDKCFTAVERDDYDSFKACFSAEDREKMTELDFYLFRDSFSFISDFKTDIEFVSREKTDENLYFVTLDLTLYNDNGHLEIENSSLSLAREKGKWVLVI
ncbi:MAG: hypothetical protein K2J73_08710 [Oscillospiraceae bacterium]|nr:hypothetical protein [Oscillospiraceae bacterium]